MGGFRVSWEEAPPEPRLDRATAIAREPGEVRRRPALDRRAQLEIEPFQRLGERAERSAAQSRLPEQSLGREADHVPHPVEPHPCETAGHTGGKGKIL